MKRKDGHAFRKSANPGLAAVKQALLFSNAAGIHADQRPDPKRDRRHSRQKERLFKIRLADGSIPGRPY